MNRFDEAAKSWDSKPSSVAIAKACVENINEIIDVKDDFKILDYGCGTGLIAFGLSNAKHNVLGMDYSKGMVEKFNEKAKELNYENVKAIQHNINEENLPKNEFDLIATSMTLHHILDTNMFVRKCKEALKVGGYLCINDLVSEDGTFHKKHNNDGVEHFGFDVKELCEKIYNHGFEIIESKVVHTDYRNEKDYPIFQIIAKLTTKNLIAIFGNPVAHSKSPQMQNAGLKHINFDAKYIKHHLENGETIKDVFNQNEYIGANITVPHKEHAYANADIVEGLANKIKAVNTFIKKDNKVVAYNTDAPGFIKAIESFGDVKNVLLLGAGGTAKAISLALQENNINVTVLNRSEGKLEFFKNENIECSTWDSFKVQYFDLVVNSTSAGLKDEYLPAPIEILEPVLKKVSFAFDCVYGKITPFLALAKQNNCEIKDGEDMLLYQGVLAFELFTDTKADEAVVEAMRKGLKN